MNFNNQNRMNFQPYPQNTKETRTNNNLQANPDFFKPQISNPSVPLYYNHESYSYNDRDVGNNIDRMFISSRPSTNRKGNSPVQSSFQSDYYTMAFNNMENQGSRNDEINNFLTRNPVNTRRDDLEKTRNIDRKDFLQVQGGYLSNFSDIRQEYTRKEKNQVNSGNYVPMPCTQAIPKEHI